MTNKMFEPTPGAFEPSGFFDKKKKEEIKEEPVEEEELDDTIEQV